MTKLNLTETELAQRWGISPKTLQRWRSENRGPSYLKLSKRVTYPVQDILAFEHNQKKVRQNSHDATLLRPDDTPNSDTRPSLVNAARHSIGTGLISAEEAISATKLPAYFFTDAAVREKLEIPHYIVAKLVRFKLDELRLWEISKACQAFGVSAEAVRPTGQNDESMNPKVKIGLHEALRRLNNETSSDSLYGPQLAI